MCQEHQRRNDRTVGQADCDQCSGEAVTGEDDLSVQINKKFVSRSFQVESLVDDPAVQDLLPTRLFQDCSAWTISARTSSKGSCALRRSSFRLVISVKIAALSIPIGRYPMRRLPAQHPIHARSPNAQPDGDLRGPDAL